MHTHAHSQLLHLWLCRFPTLSPVSSVGLSGAQTAGVLASASAVGVIELAWSSQMGMGLHTHEGAEQAP